MNKCTMSLVRLPGRKSLFCSLLGLKIDNGSFPSAGDSCLRSYCRRKLTCKSSRSVEYKKDQSVFRSPTRNIRGKMYLSLISISLLT